MSNSKTKMRSDNYRNALYLVFNFSLFQRKIQQWFTSSCRLSSRPLLHQEQQV